MQVEERTVQFLIERWCPESMISDSVARRLNMDAFYAALPLPVWVFWPPRPRGVFDTCGLPMRYALTPESIEEVAGITGYCHERAHVCGHMGKVIE